MFGRIAVNAALAGAICVSPQLGLTHHSVSANFDNSSAIELAGVISEVHIRNPHSQFVLDVTEDDGTLVKWLIEWADRNALTRRGVDVELIKVGDELTIVAWPSHRLEHVGYFVQAILPDGSIFRDCGFREFRQAVANSTEFRCEEARGGK